MDLSHIVDETKALLKLSSSIALMMLILFVRSIMTMLFLSRLGGTTLAAGSLAMAFANITGYSVLFGLSLGIEPICTQAFGARRPMLLSLTLHRTVIFLLLTSIPIAILWVKASHILISLHQDHEMARLARTYLLFTLPDLISNSFIHPTHIYLRAQGTTFPLTLASIIGTILQLPMSYLLVSRLHLGLVGVATASSVANFLVLVAIVFHMWWTALHLPTWTTPTRDCLTGWGPLVRLVAPSCASVCLEWWWNKIMVVLCGLLVDPQASVASMGTLIQTTGLLYVFPSSLSFVVLTRVGNELGANRPDKARLSAMVSVCFAGLVGVSATTLLFITSEGEIWARWFIHDPSRLRLTSLALRIIGLCQLGIWVQTVGCGVVRGTARPTVVAIVNLGAFYLVGMPIGVGLAFGLRIGFFGLSIGLISAQICCAELMYVVGTTDWEHLTARAEMLTSNRDAGGSEDKRLA